MDINKKSDSKKYSLGYFFLSDKRTLTESSGWLKAFKYFLIKSFGKTVDGLYRYKRFRNTRKWFSDVYYRDFEIVNKHYIGDFPIELPIWVAVCINREQWSRHVSVDINIIFHMWFNDIAMQFLSQNVPIYVTKDLAVVNHQSIKELFGQHRSSADAGRANGTNHVERYGPHLKHFEEKWGFDYEDVVETFPRNRYENTLVQKFFDHNPATPLRLE